MDAPPHKISIEQTVEMAKDFELLVLFTSTPGFHVDVKIAEMMKDIESQAEGRVRRSAGHGRAGEDAARQPRPSTSSCAASSTTRSSNYAKGKPLEELPGVSFRKNGGFVHNPEGGHIENLDELPWVTKVYKRDLDFRRYNVPFLLNPFISFYTSRGCPAHVHVLPVAADALRPPLAPALGRRHRERSAATRSRTSPD